LKKSLGQVVVDVLGKEYDLEEFNFDLVPEKLFDWELGGITDPIGQLFSWLWSQVQGAISWLQTNVIGQLFVVRDWLWGMINTAIGGISSAITSVYDYVKRFPDFLSDLAKTIGGFFEPLLSAINNVGAFLTGIGKSLGDVWTFLQGLGKSILESVSSAVSRFVTGIMDGIKGLQSFFSSVIEALRSGILSAISGIGTFLGDLWKGISSIGSQIYNWLKSGWDWLWSGIIGLKDWISSGIKTIAVSLTQIGTTIFDFMKSIPQFFENLWAWIQGGLKEVGATLGNAWNVAQTWFKDTYNTIATGVGEVKVALSGFINPLIGIKGGLDPFLTSYTQFIPIWQKSFTAYQMSPEVVYHQNMDMYVGTAQFDQVYKEGAKKTSSALSGILDQIGKGIVGAAQGLWASLTKGIQDFIAWLGGGLVGMMNWASKLVSPKSPSIVDDISLVFYSVVFGPMTGVPLSLITTLHEQEKKGAVEPTVLFENIVKSYIRSISGSYALSMFLRAIGDQLKVVADIKPFGLGAGIELRLGSLLKHLGRMFWKVPDVIISSLGYGVGMWLTQPYMRLLNSETRNSLPVEMPSLEEIRILANRASVMPEFDEVYEELYRFMAYYGYSDWSISWNIGVPKDHAGKYITKVKDRFNRDLTIPLTLRHGLPSAPELAAMMVRDIFPTVADFQKVMLAQGYMPDVASMYYLMRWRYPTLENLWTFIARMSAGFGWVTAIPEVEENIGFTGQSPKAISDAVKANPIQGIQTLTQKLLPYAKWWDYAPFAWQEGFTSDRLIMLDLMADIPMRIDARWMYKWSVIDDDMLMRIVVARGMHPDFVESVTVAEAMNALTEERTIVRTGVANLFESGFIGETQFDSKMTKLATIKILGKEREVKFLEGERILLKLRSQMDRAINVLKSFWSNLTSAFSRNVVDSTNVMSIIAKAANGIKEVTGLDIALDSQYLQIWLSSYEIRKETETITRVRYWTRALIYRATQLARAGVDISALIDDFAKKAMLTPVETEIMKTLASALVADAKRTSAISAAKALVRGRLKRGAISLQEALDELKKACMSDVEAQAFLENEVKVRTVSTDKLISMAEYIPIDPKVLEKKMDAEGVPEDERKLYRPYLVATEVKEEMDRVVTEMLTDYQAGLMTDQMFMDNLNKLATLDGTVQTKYGVDWIIYSPEERDILLALAKLRKARALAKAK
jgi:hypothetical protein